MSNIQPRLQYNYAKVNLTTGECTSYGTFSYQINNPAYIEIPVADPDYYGKFYDFDTGLWYVDSEKTALWEECPSHNV